MLTDGLNDVQKLQLSTYGTLDDVWLIEAYFSHLSPSSVFDGRCSTKPEVYKRVADFLMSEGIVRIVVSKNGETEQRIRVDDSEELAWEAIVASLEGQAAMHKLAEKARQDIAEGRTEPGGFDGLSEEEA